MDKFFNQTHCDRCDAPLSSRIMSWFNNDTICVDKCKKAEDELKAKLPGGGRTYEGCGYIPKVSEEEKVAQTLFTSETQEEVKREFEGEN